PEKISFLLTLMTYFKKALCCVNGCIDSCISRRVKRCSENGVENSK
ncbi:MAG: hypothetical protein ACI8SJ_002557, partial [Shewanella sp.]